MKLRLFFIVFAIIRLVSAQGIQDSVILDVDPAVDILLNSWNRNEKRESFADRMNKGSVIKSVDHCAATLKKRGYKIQVFSTKDRYLVQEKLKKLIDIYPDLYPELKFENPDYKLYLGNYLYKKSCEDDLRKIRREIPYAFRVRAYVWCKRAR
ncbi:MAG: hypothetical protein ACMUEL_06230 [Flavobacteriales bacterium Tduv]